MATLAYMSGRLNMKRVRLAVGYAKDGY